jgi:drug/metabolite transporter (DMT)-like permease
VLRAILIIIGAIFSFSLMGVAVRFLTADYSILQISFTRNFFGFVPILLMLAYSRQINALKTPFVRREWLICMTRGGSVAIAQLCLFTAYTKLEFATVGTLVFAGPFFVTALSVPVLGARVGFWRWSAVIMGFGGVVAIMQPGTGIFSVFSVLPVMAALCYATSSTLVKLFPTNYLSGVIQLRSQIFTAGFSLILWVCFDEIKPIASTSDLGLFLALGVLGGVGVLGLVSAYRMTQLSLLAPFEYFGIPFALLLGWWFFAEAPIERLFPGVLAIVAGGLVIIWRQAKLKSDAES